MQHAELLSAASCLYIFKCRRSWLCIERCCFSTILYATRRITQLHLDLDQWKEIYFDK
jgi:hypothetical protein